MSSISANATNTMSTNTTNTNNTTNPTNPVLTSTNGEYLSEVVSQNWYTDVRNFEPEFYKTLDEQAEYYGLYFEDFSSLEEFSSALEDSKREEREDLQNELSDREDFLRLKRELENKPRALASLKRDYMSDPSNMRYWN